MSRAIVGWLMVAAIWAGLSIPVGMLAGWLAATWFYAGALSVVVGSMAIVGLNGKGKRHEPEA